MARLPPDEDSLTHYIRRANYLAYIQLNYQLRQHPSLVGNGWELINGKCYAERHMKPNLPTEVIIDQEESEESDIESTDSSSSDESDEDTDNDM